MSKMQMQARATRIRRERETAAREYEEQLQRYKLTEKQRKNFLNFVLFTKQDYHLNWHHKHLCEKLEKFARGEIKNLMVFMPPQCGKSELVSRRLPAYMLGLNPNLKFVGASYSADLSKSFNRDCQKIMRSNSYAEIFKMNEGKDVSGFRYAERADYFEIVGYSGYYKSIGIEGGGTGWTADIFDIDDPVKGPAEAYSQTQRNNVWNWYISVVNTRLHNTSQKLLTMTRWHEDDLAGRILLLESRKWETIIFPAIKEDNSNPVDPRKIGEALWEEEHSKEEILSIKATSERIYISMYQQRPSPAEGDLIKKKWYKRFNPGDLPKGITRHFYSDTAYGKEKSNNSATMNYSIHEGNLYIWDMWVVNLGYPQFKKGYINYISEHGYTSSSECVFEPKATGISVVQDLKEMKFDNGSRINVIEDTPPKDDKVTRLMASSPVIESGRVYLLEGSGWIDAYLTECAAFPNGKYSDQVDVTSGVILRRLHDNIMPASSSETESEVETNRQPLSSRIGIK